MTLVNHFLKFIDGRRSMVCMGDNTTAFLLTYCRATALLSLPHPRMSIMKRVCLMTAPLINALQGQRTLTKDAQHGDPGARQERDHTEGVSKRRLARQWHLHQGQRAHVQRRRAQLNAGLLPQHRLAD